MVDKKTILVHPGQPAAANGIKLALALLKGFEVISYDNYSGQIVDLLITGTSVDSGDKLDQAKLAEITSARRIHYNATWSDFDHITGSFNRGDKLAVVDKEAKRRAKESDNKNISSMASDCVVVTGNPDNDLFAKEPGSINSSVKKSIKEFVGDRFSILYLSQPIKADGRDWGYTEEDVLHDLASGIKNAGLVDDVALIIRFHPRQKEGAAANHEVLMAIAKSYGLLVREDDTPYVYIRDLFRLVGAVVGSETTMLPKAAYAKVAAISLQPGLKIQDRLGTNVMGVTVPIYSSGEIASVISDLMNDKRALDRYAPNLSKFETDGKSAERFASLIRSVL